MITDREILELSALEQSERVGARDITADQLLRLYLGRRERFEGVLTAFVQQFDSWPRHEAQKIDGHRASWSEVRPNFFGVPFAIKDIDAVRFAFLRAGSRALKWVWVPFDARSVRLMRKAGFILVGKTTTSEFALMPVVETDIHPPTTNPWNPAHTAGGSSGGAAAAVAAGMLPVAHAADGAGSIRIPAAFCHLFGYKASRGLTPDFYAANDPFGLSVAGAVGHYVRDVAGVLDAMRGCFHPTPESLLEQLETPPEPGLRIKICTASPLVDVDPRIAAGVADLGRVLEEMGHHVEPGEPIEGTIDEFLPVFARMSTTSPAPFPWLLQPITRWLRRLGRDVTPTRAREVMTTLTRRIDDWFGDVDLYLLPTVGVPAPQVLATSGMRAEDAFYEMARLGAFTAAFNASGQPAATIPLGLVDGLPYGGQVVARRGADVLLLKVCRALERALDWRQRRSPMFLQD